MGLSETATRLIAKYGQPAEILRPGEGTVDEYGGNTPGPDTAYPCTAMVATYTVNEKFIGAGLLDVGDQRVLVSVDGLTITPATTDQLRIGGDTLGIESVVPHAPGGTLYFWEVQARDLV